MLPSRLGIVLVTNHVSDLPVKSSPVRLKNRCLRSDFWNAMNTIKNLDSYLKDHLSGSVSALELIDHRAEAPEGEATRQFLPRNRKGDQSRSKNIVRHHANAWCRRKQGGQGHCIGGRKGGPRTIDGCGR